MAKKPTEAECPDCGKLFTGTNAEARMKTHQRNLGPGHTAETKGQKPGQANKPPAPGAGNVEARLVALEKAIPDNFCQLFPHLCQQQEEIAEKVESLSQGHPTPDTKLLDSFLNCPECFDKFTGEFMPEAAARLGYAKVKEGEPPPTPTPPPAHEHGEEEEPDEVPEPPPTEEEPPSSEGEAGAEEEPAGEEGKSVIYGDYS